MAKKEYIASIITPFHNTNLSTFQSAFDSVVHQTAGIENIEWVIVVHNSEDEYLQSVRKMAGKYESIKVYELQNDIRTASSPRNHALTKVTGKYIFFLDSDDHFTLNCIKDVTKAMEETGIAMAKFRSKPEKEDPNLRSFVDHRVRYDQTKDRIILKKGDHDMKNIVTMDNMTPWCQAIRRDFLEEHHVTFDETQHLGEDALFTIECMSHMDSVLVLPQTIGYVYYINSESTLQQMGSPTPESVLHLAQNTSVFIQNGIDAGLDMRYIFWQIAPDVAGMTLATPQMSKEQKNMVRNLIGKFIDQVEPIEADGKFFTEETAAAAMAMTRNVFFGEDAGELNEKVSEDVLMTILDHNRNTNIGQRFEFNLIHNKDAYSKKVPLTNYDFYAPIIKLMTEIGETNIFCADKVEEYVVSTGKSGIPRKIPFTLEHLRQYSDMIISALRDRAGSTFLMISGLPQENWFDDGSHVESLYGATLRSVEDSLACNSHAARFRSGWVTSPKELIFPKKSVNPRYLWLLFALLDPDVSQIVAPSTWAVLEVFEYLELYYDQILETMRTGRIYRENAITTEMMEKLERRLKPDPVRVDELEKIFENGFDEPVIRKIWPNMERIFALGTGLNTLYTEKLERYIDSSVKFIDGYLMNAESVIARSYEDGTGRYILLTNHDYFEFIPLGGETENGRLLRSDELEEGCDYELVVTNHAGLFRYRLEDIIHVEKMENGVPIFTYLRKAYNQCTCDEVTLNVNQLLEMVFRFEKSQSVSIHDYCISVDEEDKRFRIFLEPSAIGDSYQKLCDADRASLTEEIDRLLSEVSDAYKNARESGALETVEVKILEPETQLLYRDKVMYARKCMPDQIEPTRILDDPSKERFFMQFAR